MVLIDVKQNGKKTNDMSVGLFCKKCSRFTSTINWCNRHGKRVTPLSDMCKEGELEFKERANNDNFFRS